jgi:adenine deaminase
VFVGDLEAWDIARVMVDGQSLTSRLNLPRFAYPNVALTTVKLDTVSADDLAVRAPNGLQQGTVCVRTIGVADGALVTDELVEDLIVRDGRVETDPRRDVLKVAVFDRYGRGSRAIGFVQGFGLQAGALAGIIGQDSQNVVGVGASDYDLAAALNAVRHLNGGVAVAHGNRLTTLALPIAGIMTSASPAELIAGRAKIAAAFRDLGGTLRDPIFALSLAITLIVIPSLKMSNRGLFDVMSGEIVDLFV